MTAVTIHKAKTELSKLIARVEKGETIQIARRDKVVAILAPLPEATVPKKRRGWGDWKGQVTVVGDLVEPMTDAELGFWEDNPIEPPR